jgi:hypothetical protein
VGKPELKRPLGRPKHREEYNIKMGHREIGWGGLECIHLAQNRDLWHTFVNAVMSLQLP